MHVPINVKSPNNISKWQMRFNSAFKGLIDLLSYIEADRSTSVFVFIERRRFMSWSCFVLFCVTRERIQCLAMTQQCLRWRELRNRRCRTLFLYRAKLPNQQAQQWPSWARAKFCVMVSHCSVIVFGLMIAKQNLWNIRVNTYNLCYCTEIFLGIWTGMFFNKIWKTFRTGVIAQCSLELSAARSFLHAVFKNWDNMVH
jgi:hypothetical protein